MKRLIVGIFLCGVGSAASAALDIQHWTTSNGARVYFVETHQIPMVQMMIGFDAAGSRDPEHKHGLAALTNSLMDDGAGGMDEDAVAEELASVGADFSSESARDTAILEMRVLSEAALMNRALDVLAKILSAPDFPSEALERERKRTVVAIRQSRQSPRDVVNRAFYANLYPSHPYGHMPEGDEDSIQRINREDLVDFHARYYTGTNAVIALVGDLRRDQAESVAERVLGSLPKGQPAPPLPRVGERQQGVYVEEEFPSQQSHLLLGQPGTTRDDPDYFPLYVGNHILGGSGLISRLSNQIREQRGLAYSVYSYFISMRREGPYIVGLQTRNDQAEDARLIALDTVRMFIEEGPTEEELQAAKNNITGGFPLRIDSNEEIANNLLSLAFYDLPLDYLDTFSDKVSAVTADQIKDAFQRRIDPQSWVQVRVGPQGG